ncbi:MAG: hypothetical protein ACYST9_04835, partial [Planctomycetota bacterium]
MGKSQTTDSCKRYDRLLILGLIVFLSGCISDNVADHGALSSYQEQLAGEGSQKRLGEESLQALTPDPEVKLPKLGVVTDANSGINRLNLSIEQAITRTLANSPEIRVVSFEPEIAKEELTGQVAEFDQILFGEYNYNKDDNPINSLTFSDVGQAKTRIWQAGIKQKSVTGSAWSFTWALTRGWDDLATRRYPTRYEPMLSFQLKQPLLRDGWQEVVLAGVNVARLNYEINFAAFRERLENVATQVIKTYWQLLQTRKESQIQQRLLDKTI